MWSCRQADGEEEEELMLSSDEKEVQPICFFKISREHGARV